MTNTNKIHHIQYPVGQGGLHLGIIGNVAYIYDCGTLRKRSAPFYSDIFDEITKLVSQCNKMYIFISHLHSDHYNLLQELSQHIPTNIPVCLYLPQTTYIDKITLLLYEDNLNDYKYVYDIIDHDNFSDLDLRYERILINTGESFKIPISADVILKPFVFGMNNEEITEFIQYNGYGSTEKLWKDLSNQDKFRQFKQNFEKKYPNKAKDENNVMLCLYCGPDQHIKDLYSLSTVCCRCRFRLDGGWLHTGDAKLKLEDNLPLFYQNYAHLLQNVSFIQIPHHGGQNNHDVWFSKILPCMGHNVLFYYTSQNYGNTTAYLSDLKVYKKQIYRVSDKKNTKITI